MSRGRASNASATCCTQAKKNADQSTIVHARLPTSLDINAYHYVLSPDLSKKIYFEADIKLGDTFTKARETLAIILLILRRELIQAEKLEALRTLALPSNITKAHPIWVLIN